MSNAANADAGVLNALGYGAENIFNPKSTLQQLVEQLGLGGLKLAGGSDL